MRHGPGFVWRGEGGAAGFSLSSGVGLGVGAILVFNARSGL